MDICSPSEQLVRFCHEGPTSVLFTHHLLLYLLQRSPWRWRRKGGEGAILESAEGVDRKSPWEETAASFSKLSYLFSPRIKGQNSLSFMTAPPASLLFLLCSHKLILVKSCGHRPQACSILSVVQEAAVERSTVIFCDLVPSAASRAADHLQAGGKATLASFSRGLLGCSQPATGNPERLPRGTKGHGACCSFRGLAGACRFFYDAV